MKFKKVEIQAFRAYNKEAEGTFDFVTENDQEADFISIYAPNGFGKTSFYDAVEWGVTHNIHRFLKRYKFNQQVARTEKNLNDANQPLILRNRFSDPKLPAFVRLHTSASKEPIYLELKKPRKGQPDYKFDERETVRNYFQEVILSQEWIDSFLKEDNPSDRYQTFIRYFGDKDLDLYYRTIVGLSKANDENVRRLEKELQGLQLDLKFDGDQTIMSNTNQVITNLNKHGHKLNYISSDFTDKESVILGSLIIARQNELEFRIEHENATLQRIADSISGTDEQDGLTTYFQNQKRLTELTQLISGLKENIRLFENLHEYENMMKNLIENKKFLIASRSEQEFLIKSFPGYLNVLESLKAIFEQQLRLSSSRKGTRATINEKELQIASATSALETFRSSISALDRLIEELPGLQTTIQTVTQNIADFNQRLEKINEDITLTGEMLEEAIKAERLLNELTEQLKGNHYPKTIEFIFSVYSDRIDELRNLQTEIQARKDRIRETEASIREQQTFQSEVEELVRKGLALINDSQTDTCPLCRQNYESYQALSDKVAANTLFSTTVRNLLSSKNEQERGVNSLINIEKDRYSTLMAAISRLQVTYKTTTEEVRSQLSGLQAEKKKLDTSTKKENLKLQDLITILKGQSIENYKVITVAQRDDLATQAQVQTDRLGKLQNELSILKVEEDVLKVQISQTIDEENRQEMNPDYLTIITYAKQLVTPAEQDPIGMLSILENRLKQILLELDNLLIKEKQFEIDLIAQRVALETFNEEILNKQLPEMEEQKATLRRRLSVYSEFIMEHFKFDINENDEDTNLLIFNTMREASQSMIADYRQALELFTLLIKLKDGLLPFLKYEKAKKDEKDIKARVKFLKNTLKKELETERKRIAEHIDQQINSFFYEDVINDLYRKIDPHPDYKTIKFKCDFSEDKPQLNVCVTDEQQELLQIPNLYFSTAQLNILSLSIFLAKALHAVDDDKKPLECIFIDDPIQSMDSINILSTIDLLRSIVVNHKRQIILSTHDANFHNLLQKKIPGNLFKAKYMELETFGKVKNGI